MTVGNRIAELGNTNFKTEDDYAEWSEKVQALILDLSRELEDAAVFLKATLSVTKVKTSFKKEGKLSFLDLRAEHVIQARKLAAHLKRAATTIAASRGEVASARAIFCQYWTKDGGLAAETASAKNASNRMKLNTDVRRRKSA